MFLIDRRARGSAEGTIRFYKQKLAQFCDFLTRETARPLTSITSDTLRRYLLRLSETHNPGGVHAAYRALKALFNWWELEEEPAGWKNPCRKVKPPRVPTDPLEPVDPKAIQAMLRTCDRRSFIGHRDCAILMVLVDTGCRASEFLDINLGDIDLTAGQILIRKGKGAKPRMVFLGKKSKRALARFLSYHEDSDPDTSLWITSEGKRLSYSGLRDIIRRRARRAQIDAPTLHSFRRGFALSCLRNGMDVYSLQRLMGHSSLNVLRRYLAQTNDDLQAAHSKYGPADTLLGGIQ